MGVSFIRLVVALAVGCVVGAPPAKADTLAAALEVGTVREASDFSHPFANTDIATLTKVYDSGFSWTGFLQNARNVRSGRSNWAFEGLVGYRHAYSESLSLYGNAGAGEFLSPVRSFPYLTFRAGVDHALNRKLIWNVVNLRYRDGLDFDFAYRSSVAGTGLTYRMSDEFAVYTRVFAVFDTQFHFDGTGLALGVRKYF